MRRGIGEGLGRIHSIVVRMRPGLSRNALGLSGAHAQSSSEAVRRGIAAVQPNMCRCSAHCTLMALHDCLARTQYVRGDAPSLAVLVLVRGALVRRYLLAYFTYLPEKGSGISSLGIQRCAPNSLSDHICPS